MAGDQQAHSAKRVGAIVLSRNNPTLILGASGMLGQALVLEGRRQGLNSIGVARREHPQADRTLDVLDDAALTRAIVDTQPATVINAVAQVSLAACEADPGEAYRVNARLPARLAALSIEHGFQLVQVSTDHYFTGDGASRHGEESEVRLVNEYARTKYAGEAFALTAPDAWVLRTNLVGYRGSPRQPTFVEWALEGLARHTPMTLFADYFSSSISVRLFASILLEALPRRPSGLFNLAGSEVVSKLDFVEALAQAAGLDTRACKVGSVASLAGVQRAESLGLDVRRAEDLLQRKMPGLSDTIASLMSEYAERKSCVTTAPSR